MRLVPLAAALTLASVVHAVPPEDSVYRQSAGTGQHAQVLDATDLQQPVTVEPPSAAPEAPGASASPGEERSSKGALLLRSRGSSSGGAATETSRMQPVVTVTSSLAIVLGLFAAVAFLYRRAAP